MTRVLALFAVAALLTSCRTTAPDALAHGTEVKCYLESATDDAVPYVLPQSGVRILVAPTPMLNPSDILGADVAQVDLGPGLMLRISPAAVRRLASATSGAVGRRLVLTIDGEAVAARRIDAPISVGLLFFFVEMRESDLTQLVSDLHQGTSRTRSTPRSTQ